MYKESTARKRDTCYECGKTIEIGKRYSRFIDPDDSHHLYRMCLECGGDWVEILKILHKNGEITTAYDIFSSLRDAVQNAFDEGLLSESDQLVRKWLYIEEENLSPQEIEVRASQKAIAQMKAHSVLLI